MYKTIAVFCGASNGKGTKYTEASRELGSRLAQAGLGMVYGGARVGTMGAVSGGAMEHGGTVTGVFPAGFEGHCVQEFDIRELVAENITELIYTGDFFSRVEKMMALSDACIVCPGGVGTLHELFSYALYSQLRFHDKPVYIYNLDGYYDSISVLLQKIREEEFMTEKDCSHIHFCNTAEEIIKALTDGE